MPECTADDPKRCQGITENGQCNRLAEDGSKFCRTHSRTSSENREKERLRHYLLSNPDLQKRLNRQAGIEQVRSLREEVHLARVMVEARLDMIEPDNKGDMLAAFSSVNTLLQTIEKLVSSCHRMEVSLGSLLSKSSVFSLGQDIVGILAEELKDIDGYEHLIDRISERMVTAISEQQNEESKGKK
jgi:hypothetical protein